MRPECYYAPEKFHLAALRPLSSCVSWTSLRVALTHAVFVASAGKESKSWSKIFLIAPFLSCTGQL